MPSAEELRPYLAKLRGDGTVQPVPLDRYNQIRTSNGVFIHTKVSLPEDSDDERPLSAAQLRESADGVATAFMASLRAHDSWERASADTCSSAKLRFIFNAKTSLNPRLDEWRFRYPSFGDYLAFVKPRGYMAKVDIKSGFYHVRMHPDTWRDLVFWIDGVAYYFTRLPMGLRCAPAIFSWLTGEINCILQAMGHCCTLVYVDDFLLYADSKLECDAALAALRGILAALGIAVAADKSSTESSQRMLALGFIIDTVVMTVAVPARSVKWTLAMASVVLTASREQRMVPNSFIEKLVGRLCHMGTVDTMLATFTRELGSLTHFDKPLHRLWVPEMQPKLDCLSWVLERATGGRLAVRMSLRDASAPAFTVHATSDATTSPARPTGPPPVVAVAARFGEAAAFRLALGEEAQDIDIAILELMAIVAFVLRYGPFLSGARLRFGVDNSAVTYWCNSGRSGRGDALAQLKLLAMALERFGLGATFWWLTRRLNHVCDRIAAGPTIVEASKQQSPTVAIAPAGKQDGFPRDIVLDTLQAMAPSFIPPSLWRPIRGVALM